MTDRHDDRSIGELLVELSRETSTLVRKELELARTEIGVKAQKAAMDAGMVGGGGALMHAGVLVLLAAVVAGLIQLGMMPWLAAAIVAAVTIIIGYVMVNRGITNLRRIDVAPRQAIETLKENATWTTRQGA
jgi:hypothetical protein